MYTRRCQGAGWDGEAHEGKLWGFTCIHSHELNTNKFMENSNCFI